MSINSILIYCVLMAALCLMPGSRKAPETDIPQPPAVITVLTETADPAEIGQKNA